LGFFDHTNPVIDGDGAGDGDGHQDGDDNGDADEHT
jgi:hypothetical protein